MGRLSNRPVQSTRQPASQSGVLQERLYSVSLDEAHEMVAVDDGEALLLAGNK